MEQRIASNSKDNASAFFVAEGGIRHAMALLKSQLETDISTSGTTNAINLSKGDSPTWTFLLNGGAPAQNYYCQGCYDTPPTADMYTGGWLTRGVTVVDRTFTQGNFDFNYKVYVWNNSEVWKTDVTACAAAGMAAATGIPSATVDCDSVVYLRSVAVAYYRGTTTPAGPESVQEATIAANLGDAVGMLSGLSQEFANEGKTSSAVDVREIGAGNLRTGVTM
jgi:Tfp pilus assembly protein PilX